MSLDHQESTNPSPPSRLSEELDHDLRTPLAVIRVQTQLLLRTTDKGGPAGAAERERLLAGLRRIDAAVSTMLTTIERINGRGSWQEEPRRNGRTT